MKNHALERFRRPPERMNCAEAVLCQRRNEITLKPPV